MSRTAILIVFLIIASGCVSEQAVAFEPPSRGSAIPADAVKMHPADDMHPPIMHSGLWNDPVPLDGPVNTAGGEDSAFMAPDGRLFFFFTPDVGIPAEKQVLDNVTGIYYTKKTASGWSEPERVLLTEPGKLALDGCGFVQGSEIWFCSAREGYTGINVFTARFEGGRWTDVQPVGQVLKDYEVGEMHIAPDGALYFHSGRAGGKGGYDIWMTKKVDGQWREPVNVEAVNTPETEGWPYISEDGKELWFTRFHQGSPAIFRSAMADGAWSEPELIISRFAGESTMDSEGNIYFTHHFYNESGMIEADIYLATKK
ncbi:MAG: hypothetical protein AB1295_05845 [Candidatus Micrarchaeota archaeon]